MVGKQSIGRRLCGGLEMRKLRLHVNLLGSACPVADEGHSYDEQAAKTDHNQECAHSRLTTQAQRPGARDATIANRDAPAGLDAMMG